MGTDNEKLKNFLLSYSSEDLLRSFLVLNIWLPNIASPIKIQYLYAVLESLHKDLSFENKIKSYADFQLFCKDIIEILPSFAMLEDYVPEADWGEIKYYFDSKTYSIFYGADLSNPYDFYYSFEIIHRNFDDYYCKIIQRSALQEFGFCLSIQDHLIKNINQVKPQSLSVSPGDIGVPSSELWAESNRFLDQFDPESHFDRSLINRYTRDFDSGEVSTWPELGKFMERAFEGKNCPYYFIKKNRKYFPVMPRKYFSILYDKWGKILKENYRQIESEKKNPEIGIGIELFKFIRDRADEDEIFGLVSPIDQNQKPYLTTFATAIRSKDKLFLIYVVPPPIDKTALDDYLKKLNGELKESHRLLSIPPTRLGLWVQKRIVEFRSKKEGNVLTPVFLTVVPYHLTSEMIRLAIPQDFPGEVIGLDQIAGIFDEIKDENELSDFFDFLNELQSISIPPITSYLDKFGAFRDSSSVLIPGARTPDMVIIDFNWGSNIRYRSLSEFWEQFPEINFFGHPRSWLIPEKSGRIGGVILKSRKFFGYAYCQKVGNATFFINSPINLMSFNQSKITDLVMQSIFDALAVYENEIQKLRLAKGKNRIQILISPASLVKEKTELNHLSHLMPGKESWLMDITRLKNNDYGIRIVYDDQKVISAFQTLRDRSVQVDLLLDILRQANTIWNDGNLSQVEQNLIKERVKRCRFKIFSINKTVSFPEMVRTVLPEEKDFKIANKIVAQSASNLGITPGKYTLEEAKSKLNQLITKLIDYIASEVSKFDFEKAVTLLLEKIDALANEYDIRRYEIRESFDQEVDYEREGKTSEDHIKFLHHHKNYRYLIEKFVQIQPSGEQELTVLNLKNLLALVDRILNIYSASDIIQYDIYPTDVTIDSDFITSITYTVDVPAMEAEYSKEQAQIDLGIIGNKEDVPDSRMPIIDYLEELDRASQKDFGFGFRNLVNVQQVMSLWPAYYKDVPENSYYSATLAEITQVCSEGIKDFNSPETEKILDFLTLKPEEMLKIVGDDRLANDLPIWEYKKRLTRYSIKPLIKINGKYYWGPHSVDRAGRIWGSIPHANRLPVDINAPTVWSVLGKRHKDIEISLVDKIKEIAKRYSSDLETNVYPHKLSPGMANIGDSDVLVFLKEKNTLINIESKIIDPAYCLKDIKRVREKIFGRTKTDGSFEKGYLQRIEQRETYLKQNYSEVMKKLGWDVPSDQPKVVSVFATQISFWWTKFPPIDTEVKFVEIKLLDNFIKNL